MTFGDATALVVRPFHPEKGKRGQVLRREKGAGLDITVFIFPP